MIGIVSRGYQLPRPSGVNGLKTERNGEIVDIPSFSLAHFQTLCEEQNITVSYTYCVLPAYPLPTSN